MEFMDKKVPRAPLMDDLEVRVSRAYGVGIAKSTFDPPTERPTPHRRRQLWIALGAVAALVALTAAYEAWLSRGQGARELAGHSAAVSAIAWSPDGSRLASGDQDGNVLVWDTGAWATVATAHNQTDRVSAVAWSADGTRLATASPDGSVRVLDPSTGTLSFTIPGQEDLVDAVAWSPEGARLAVIRPARVEIWDGAAGALVRTLAHDGGVRAVVWSPDGSRIATAGNDAAARIWDPATGDAVQTLADHDAVTSVSWSPDGERLVTTTARDVPRFWNAATGESIPSPFYPDAHLARQAAWSPAGSLVAVAGLVDGTVWLWDADVGEAHCELILDATATSMAWSRDGFRLATLSSGTGSVRGGVVQVWDAWTGVEVEAFRHDVEVNTFAWSPDGSLLATACDDGMLRLWKVGAMVAP